jgi:hypothetical protein
MNKFKIFFLAGILFAVQISYADKLLVNVTNLLQDGRNSEVVSIPLKALEGFENVKPAVYCEKFNSFMPTQLVDNDCDGKNDELLFQADFKAKQTLVFEIVEANAANYVEVYGPAQAYYIPQRKDDFAWENDKIAFRVYGQELQRTELTSSGIDVWVKKVQKPVMLALYAKGHDYYHSENPLAIDFFNVGETLGCGGLGVWDDGKLLRSENYSVWKIIANGPIRTIFALRYEPWDMGKGKKMAEVKKITLDKGWNFCKIEDMFDGDVNDIKFAVGITKCERGGKPTFGTVNEYLSYWQKPDKNFGTIGCGVILNKPSVIYEQAEDQENYMILAMGRYSKVVYYAGACWSRTKGFEKEETWNLLVRKTSERVNGPLSIEIKKKIGKRR